MKWINKFKPSNNVIRKQEKIDSKANRKFSLKDYIVLDIETPNHKNSSICSIAFIQVKENVIIKKESYLINPEDRFDDKNMSINRITPMMVKDAITLDKFWHTYGNLLTNNVIVGHNIKFDISAITKALSKYKIKIPEFKIICTLELSKKYFNLENYNLDKICQHLKIEFNGHHDALCDTEACYNIFNLIMSNYNLEINDIMRYKYQSNNMHATKNIIYSESTKSMQQFKQIVESILSDNVIETKEIYELNNWLDHNTHLIGYYPFDKINNTVKCALEDGKLSIEEKETLMIIFTDFINPIKENVTETIEFTGSIFCLTGAFNTGSKSDIETMILNRGGLCSKNLTMKTNYLIVGGQGADEWKFGNYGGKVQKAMEYNDKGKNIKIIYEDEFIKELKESHVIV